MSTVSAGYGRIHRDHDTQRQYVCPGSVAFSKCLKVDIGSFYGWRIHKSTLLFFSKTVFNFLIFAATVSKSNWWLTGPIVLLAITRVGMWVALKSDEFL